MSATATIKVTPEKLVEKAAELQKKVVNVKEHFAAMNALVEKTERYWMGEAGNFHRELYQGAIKEEEAIMKRMEEHPKDLYEIAGRYINVEEFLKRLTNALPNNVIT